MLFEKRERGSAFAYTTFAGLDNNRTPGSPATYANSTGAQTTFLSNLIGVGTENFEAIPSSTGSPINLTFPGAGTGDINVSNGSQTDGSVQYFGLMAAAAAETFTQI